MLNSNIKSLAYFKKVSVLQVQSGGYHGGNLAKISINNKEVRVEKNA